MLEFLSALKSCKVRARRIIPYIFISCLYLASTDRVLASDFEVIRRQWSEILKTSILTPPAGCAEAFPEAPVPVECEDLNAFPSTATKSPVPLTRKNANDEFSNILKDLRNQVATWKDGPAKDSISARINSAALKLDNSACSSESDRDSMNASYDDDSKTFTICEGVLRAGSRMTLVRTIAHEIGHLVYFSLTRDQKKNLLPPDLLTCLRSAEGANAKPEEMSTRFKVYGKLSDASKEFLAGYSSEAYEDQLNEVFADYFSAEYMASVSIDGFSPKDYANAYAESVPATAIDSEPEKWARYEKESEYPFWCAHPRRSDRLNRIIMVHPGIRQRMGCPSVVAPKGRYCGALSSYF